MNSKWVRWGVLVVILLSIWVGARLIPEETLRDMVEKAGVFGPAGVIVLLLVTYVIAPVSGTPILYASYFLYGIEVIWLATVAGYLSYITNFWIGRKFGTPVVEKLVGKENLDKINPLIMGKGGGLLFLSRMFYGGLHDIVSYVAGLSDVSFKKYITTSTAAIIPGTAIWYLLATTVDSAEGSVALTLTMGGVLSVILVVVMGFVGYNTRNGKDR